MSKFRLKKMPVKLLPWQRTKRTVFDLPFIATRNISELLDFCKRIDIATSIIAFEAWRYFLFTKLACINYPLQDYSYYRQDYIWYGENQISCQRMYHETAWLFHNYLLGRREGDIVDGLYNEIIQTINAECSFISHVKNMYTIYRNSF